MLVVVVPAGVDAHVQDLAPQPLLPPAQPGGVREVEEGRLPIPVGLDHGPALAVDDEAAVTRQGAEGRVVVQQAGLDVGHDVQPGLVEARVQRLRLGELVAVPGVDVAPRPAHRVARAVVEGRHRHAVGADLVDEGVQPRLRVGRIGQAHGRLRIAQRPARRQRRAADEANELRDHLAGRRAGHQVQVQVAVVDLDVAVEAVVVVVLAAQVEGAGRERVVVQAEPVPLRRAAQHEGPVLVQRVTVLGVVAQRVHRQRAQAPAVQVQRPGLVAQAVVALGPVALQVVAHGAGARAAQVGRGAAVLGQQRPPTAGGPAQAQRGVLQRHRQRARVQARGAVGVEGLQRRRREAGAVVARAALPGHVAPGLGRDRPGARLAPARGRAQRQPRHRGREKTQAHRRAVVQRGRGALAVEAPGGGSPGSHAPIVRGGTVTACTLEPGRRGACASARAPAGRHSQRAGQVHAKRELFLRSGPRDGNITACGRAPVRPQPASWRPGRHRARAAARSVRPP